MRCPRSDPIRSVEPFRRPPARGMDPRPLATRLPRAGPGVVRLLGDGENDRASCDRRSTPSHGSVRLPTPRRGGNGWGLHGRTVGLTQARRRRSTSSSLKSRTTITFACEVPAICQATDVEGRSSQEAMRRATARLARPSDAGSRQVTTQHLLQGSHASPSRAAPGRTHKWIRTSGVGMPFPTDGSVAPLTASDR